MLWKWFKMRLFEFIQNEGIFIQLDELEKLDKITHAWIRLNLQSHISTENTLERLTAVWLGFNLWQVCQFFDNFILLNSSN